MDIVNDKRFRNMEQFKKKVLLASPTMHGEELDYMEAAYNSGWMTTVGENINIIEKKIAEFVGVSYAVALTSGTAALHLAVKLAAERLYNSHTGTSTPDGKGLGGALLGKRVFCSDLTFDATVNPIVYEGGEPVFIDSEPDTWNMSPEALEQAFKLYPDVKLVVLVHLYGMPANVASIKSICNKYGALIIEDAAESLGATVGGVQTGGLADYGVISFNGNKIITGSSGGMLLVHDKYSADKARKWSTQSREAAPWYQHEELGYNYRISNVIAGVIRGQIGYLSEHISRKKEIWEKYRSGFINLPIKMNTVKYEDAVSNYWLSCFTIDSEYLAKSERSEHSAVYSSQTGKSSPTEILEALEAFHAEGRPIWKPMHMQPLYRNNAFITKNGNGRGGSDAYIQLQKNKSMAEILFESGLCLPSDNKMSKDEQDMVIEIIQRCFE